MGLLAAVNRSQQLQNCTSQLTIRSTEDAATLATSLGCSDGDVAVEWVGEVFIEQTIRVTAGTSLNITGVGSDASADGRDVQQLFVVDAGSRLHLSDMTLQHGNASGTLHSGGGAIFSNQSSVSFSGNVSFSFNSASDGGAILAYDSVMSWNGNNTQFISNSAVEDGGAIYAKDSTVSWGGDGTQFISNSAVEDGGAIYAEDSTISWDGDGTQFISNAAVEAGGAIYAEDSTVSWDGDGTQFISNSASGGAGAIHALYSKVFWNGDGARFAYNSALDGGAINAQKSSVWNGGGTRFSSNSASGFGGGIYADSSAVSWGRNTTFYSNVAGTSGGALAAVNMQPEFIDNMNYLKTVYFSGSNFIENSAVTGGALYLANSPSGFNFTDVSFQNNSAAGAGGAVTAYAVGVPRDPLVFARCHFSGNEANRTGGAVETLTSHEEFTSCGFEGNSADVGGAMRVGGAADIRDCSFFSNVASTRGLAIAMVAPANISGSSFDGNQLYCAADSYRSNVEKEDATARYGTVCFDCPGWSECLGCTIARGSFTPTCEPPLEHTSTEEPGATLETLTIDGGYWRATPESENVLACFNEDACVGGKTGADDFCAPEYTGPYCAVCRAGHSSSLGYTCSRCSSSRRQGSVAIAAIVALLVLFAVGKTLQYLLSAELGESSEEWFRRRVLPERLRGTKLPVVPVQALKIVLVVWQILTQFSEAAQVAYPSMYQDFLSAIDNVINFDLGSLLAAGCFWSEIDFHDRLLISTLGPLVVVGLLAITYRIAKRRNRTATDVPDGDAGLEKIRHKHQTALLLLAFLIYSSASSTVIKTFACETLDDQIEYLRADYRIVCTDPKHRAFEVYAIFMALVYPVGIPLLYAVLLYQHREVLRDAEKDKAAAQPIAGLWEPYRPKRYYYEVVECGRRIMLTGIVVFIFPNDAAQIAITMLITFIFLMIFEMMSPYADKSDRWLARSGNVIVFLSMFYLLALKVDVSNERGQSQAWFAGVLVVLNVLMVLAIFVEAYNVWRASRISVSEGPRSTRSYAGTDGGR